MRWLHSCGIFPEALDMLGQSVVHIAARRAELEVLKYLHESLGLDALFAQEDFEGQSPYECVPRGSSDELVQECRRFIAAVAERFKIQELRESVVVI
jgi:hypothetical protein